MKTLNLNIILLVFFFSDIDGLSDAEMRAKFIKEAMICTKDYPVDIKELVSMQQLNVPTKRGAKCLLACTYKRVGSMDKKGMYSLEGGYKNAELAENGDEKRLQNGKKLADICVKVNDEAVSDGEEGCDRAALMFKCFVDNAPKLGFQLQ